MDLEEYLFRQRLKKTKFAKLIGVTPSHLYSILSGRRRASTDLAIKIEQATNGKVKKEKILFHMSKKRNLQP